MLEYRQFKHAQREKPPRACLTKGSQAWYHTRWRGLESHLFIRETTYATFREKVKTLGWLDKLEGFLSLALCN